MTYPGYLVIHRSLRTRDDDDEGECRRLLQKCLVFWFCEIVCDAVLDAVLDEALDTEACEIVLDTNRAWNCVSTLTLVGNALTK